MVRCVQGVMDNIKMFLAGVSQCCTLGDMLVCRLNVDEQSSTRFFLMSITLISQKVLCSHPSN